MFVCDDGRLVGVSRVRRSSARSWRPGSTRGRRRSATIAEPPNATLESTTLLTEAFAFLEERDYERVPVVDDGNLVGVLSRAVVQRRLAEDEPPRTKRRAGLEALGGRGDRIGLGESVARASRRVARTSSSVRCRPSSNFSGACPTASSTSVTRAPIAPSTLRSSAAAQMPPKAPALELITATGFVRKAFVANGREAQSSAFLSAPGID